MIPLHALERFARRGAPGPQAGERCELCATPIGVVHPHVVDLEKRSLCCACRACALLFQGPGAGSGRYRAVPDRVLVDPASPLDEAAFAALGIPVRLAFVFASSRTGGAVAVYPSPAGATESEVEREAWEALLASCPLARALSPDVEALLLRAPRPGDAVQALLVPVDAAYELVGVVRRHWKGFEGGDLVRSTLDGHVARLLARSRPLAPSSGGGGHP